LINFAHRLTVWLKRLSSVLLLSGLLLPSYAMAWYNGSGPFAPWGASPYGWSPAPGYRMPPAPRQAYWPPSPYWGAQPYPLNGYWPGYGGFPAPMSLAAPSGPQSGSQTQPTSPWQALQGSAPDNRWQVYGGMDQSGGVWMAFIYRGNVNGLMGGSLLGNSWPGSGSGNAGQMFAPWGGGMMQPPLDNLFQNQGWDADRPA